MNLLLKWHAQDPVSSREIDRNEEVFVHQNNRNPFIDNPEFVTMIWGDIEDVFAFNGELSGTYIDTTEDNEVNLGDEIEYTYSINNTGNLTIFNIAVAANKGLFDTPLQLDNLTAGSTSTIFAGVLRYAITQEDLDSDCKCVTNQVSFTGNTAMDNMGDILTTISDDPSINTDVDSDNDGFPDDVTNTSLPLPIEGGATTNELFISEYIEGSGLNKAIEIANFTGVPVDLSLYSVRRDGNGGENFQDPTNLVGTLNDGEVYVIINNGASESNIQAQADLVAVSTGTAAIDFNGDDPVGLFKNDVLIDIVGVSGVRENFAQNTTLVRKPEVSGPNLTFDLEGEWNTFPSNTSTDLGMHSVNSATASVNDNNLIAVTVCPNPSTGVFQVNGLNEPATISIWDVSGRMIQSNQSMDDNTFRIDGTGIYFVQLTANSSNRTFKVVVR